MIALLTTSDPVKLSAVAALLVEGGVVSETFDVAAGGLYPAIIPKRIMVADEDLAAGRRLLRQAGFVEAKDGDWDLASEG
ncbi:MAG: DUF2007 domain-containing protein [Caulobacteraceae bacterium]|jgi:hypothetical protein